MEDKTRISIESSQFLVLASLNFFERFPLEASELPPYFAQIDLMASIVFLHLTSFSRVALLVETSHIIREIYHFRR